MCPLFILMNVRPLALPESLVCIESILCTLHTTNAVYEFTPQLVSYTISSLGCLFSQSRVSRCTRSSLLLQGGLYSRRNSTFPSSCIVQLRYHGNWTIRENYNLQLSHALSSICSAHCNIS